MALITQQNNIRWNIDTLSSRVTGVLASNANSSVNLTRASKVTAITVNGLQPAGTYRYFAFRVNNVWGRLNSSGVFQPFKENNASFENLENAGNTAAELAALGNIPGLAGKSFGVAVALAADDPINAVPSASLSFKGSTNTQQLVTTEYSPIYDLGQDSQVISYNLDTTCENGGSVTVQAQITKSDGTVSGWADPETFKGIKAQSIQFKGEYRAATVGVSSAKVNSAQIVYSQDKSVISGVSDGEVITKTLDWYMPIHACRLTVHHAPLVNSRIKAFVTFRNQSVQVRGETLGVGSGGRKTFQLAHVDGLKYDSLKLYYDNAQVFTDYEFNTEVGRVTCSAPSGVLVSCDYDYGWDKEEWHEMSLDSRWSMDGYDRSEYKFSLDSNTKSAAAIKLQLIMSSGHINNEQLGTGSGTAKSFKLSHIINDGKISVTSNNVLLSTKFWTILDDPQYISVAASAGQIIRASYDWVSEPPKVYQFSAVFSE